jgi:hypothetical protein
VPTAPSAMVIIGSTHSSLILDSIIPGFRDKVTRNHRGRGRRAVGARTHFLHATENMQASFDANPTYW